MTAGLKQPRGCFLTVFLAHDVTPGSNSGVQTLLVTSKRVSTVSFVSKELALKRFAQRKPAIARRMHAEPVPGLVRGRAAHAGSTSTRSSWTSRPGCRAS